MDPTQTHATNTPSPKGMAASDPNPSSEPTAEGRVACLSAPALMERLDEEINRAVRHGTPLSCLLVTIGNLDELAREHGSELIEQTLAYVGAALRPQLRHFDRIGRPSDSELMLVLPGADGPRGEIVARRVLDRLRAIKVEADGTRQPLRIAVGLAAWGAQESSEDLLASTRAAAQRGTAADTGGVTTASPPALGRPGPS
jgi:diguanylate cyclase (GGDEF)-like protein